MSPSSVDWIEQYSRGLAARDACEQAHKPYIDAYTRLADRGVAASTSVTATPIQTNPTSSPESKLQSKSPSSAVPSGPSSDQNAIDRLRADLGATQKARAALASQVANLTASMNALQAQDKEKSSQITLLTRRKTDLERRLHDRDEELRGKLRLVQQAQDEMIAQGLQLHMSEQRQEKLEKENKELVDRWMKRVGEEAEKVNRDSKWA